MDESSLASALLTGIIFRAIPVAFITVPVVLTIATFLAGVVLRHTKVTVITFPVVL